MPPRVVKLPPHVVFGGVAGDHRKLDAAFRKSLVGEGPLSVDPVHWMLTVLPSLSPTAVTMRLLVFVFLPAFAFADDLDQEVGSVLFYPAPNIAFSRLLHRLVKEGISAEPVPDARSLPRSMRRPGQLSPEPPSPGRRSRTLSPVPHAARLSPTPPPRRWRTLSRLTLRELAPPWKPARASATRRTARNLHCC
ncbi:hypothetical protein AB1Y20_006302 [Prymnesium parvum]|uniref:Uncharacterized protein n=1 Tax=Prymnesium parvum TaxID=97485 RepID=A0AB34J4E1_PRYPA